MQRLQDAAEAHNAEAIKESLEKMDGVDSVLDARDADGHTLLHLCIMAPLVETTWMRVAVAVNALIEARANVNSANSRGETSLLLAVRESAGHGHRNKEAEPVRTLLRCRADPDLADQGCVTPLFEAVANREIRVAELLLSSGATPFVRGGPRQRTVFEEMCAKCPKLAAQCVADLCPGDTMEDAEADEAAAEKRAPPQRPPTKERYIHAMCSAVQGHSAKAVQEVLDLWKAEDWRVEDLVNWRDEYGYGWLHLSVMAPVTSLCWRSVVEVVDLLLSVGANADQQNRFGETPLWLVAREASASGDGRIELLNKLIAAGASPDRPDARGRTALMEAAELGDPQMCEALLRAGCDANLKDPRTKVSVPGLASKIPAVKAVFQKMAEPGAFLGGSDSQPQASVPSGFGRAAASRIRGKNLSPEDELREEVMLHNAARARDLLEGIQDCKALVDAVDDDGHTPLHLCFLAPPAVQEGKDAQIATCRALLDARADPNRLNRRGESVLLAALRELPPCAKFLGGRLEVTRLLLEAQADVEVADSSGRTPLVEACAQDDDQLAELLLKAGAQLSRSVGSKVAADFAPASGRISRLLADSRYASSSRSTARSSTATESKGKEASSTEMLIQAVQAHDAASMGKILSKHKADGKNVGALLTVQDADGNGLLHLSLIAPPVHADRSALPETVRALIAAKVDLNTKNDLGETPLLLVVREMAGTGDSVRTNLVRSLLRARAEVDVGDAQDTTPLMEAAMLGDAELCQLLLDRGANMDRRGGGGLSALELAMHHPHVRQVFDAQVESQPEPASRSKIVSVKLRHMVTQLERTIETPSDTCIRDVKKIIVRLASRGSWKRIVLLTEQGRALHDSEILNGRTHLIMADSKSAEAQKACQERLTEEERWETWSVDELKAEAERRGIFGGAEKQEIIESLQQAKRWEALSVQDLRTECLRRGLMVETLEDRSALLQQLKQDFSWEKMKGDDLTTECVTRGIPLPEVHDSMALERAIRSRLRQLRRWEALTVPQLQQACELRHFDGQSKTREEMLAFLKSFKTLTAKPPPPPPKPMPEPRAHAGGSRGSSRSKSRESSNSRDSWNGMTFPRGLSEHVRRICRKYPNFTGVLLPEMNEWLEQDIEAYLYSNGCLKPNKGNRAAALARLPKKQHYEALGLHEGASIQEVRRAYKKLALLYHPDKNLQDPNANAENFKAIMDAYEALTAA